jgi:hypothetical protein
MSSMFPIGSAWATDGILLTEATQGSSARNAKPTPDRPKPSVRRFLLGKVVKVQLV